MHSKSALVSLLLLAAAPVHAQSLGGAQGAVIIGRPLDIVVQSQVGASDDAGSLCLQADVRYGETRLSPSEVSISIDRSPAQPQGAIRVRTRLPVNEPFVTVEVRVGCPMRFSRAYTLLADAEPVRVPPLAVSPTPPATAASTAAAPAAVVDRPAARPAVPMRATPASPESPVRLHAPRPRPEGVANLATKARPVQPAAAAQPQASGTPQTPAPAAPAPAGPRLELEPLDIRPNTAPTAPPPTTGAAPAPGADTGPAAPSPAEPTPVPSPEASAAQQAVQEELATLRAEQQRLVAAVESLNRELTAARAGRGDNLVLYVLAGTVGVLLAALLWLVRRRSGTDTGAPALPWWAAPARGGAKDGELASDVMSELAAARDRFAPAASAESGARPPLGAAEDHMAGLEVSEAGASVFQEVPVTPLDPAALLELWERVDFFDSLGQTGDGVAALRAFVQAYPRASEAPYLRWWALARQQGTDARLPQATYEQHFQRLLPTHPGEQALEDDASFMPLLNEAWPADAARVLIESALASQPGDPGGPLTVRTLAAFDDLLLLLRVLDVLPLIADTPAAPAPAPAPVSGGLAAAAALAPMADAGPSVLDFELPDVADLTPAGASPASAPASADAASPAAPASAPAKDDDALDFDFSGWQPPPGEPPIKN